MREKPDSRLFHKLRIESFKAANFSVKPLTDEAQAKLVKVEQEEKTAPSAGAVTTATHRRRWLRVSGSFGSRPNATQGDEPCLSIRPTGRPGEGGTSPQSLHSKLAVTSGSCGNPR